MFSDGRSTGSPLHSGGRMPLVDSQRGLADMSAMDDAPPLRDMSDFQDFGDHSAGGGSVSRCVDLSCLRHSSSCNAAGCAECDETSM